MLRGKRILIVEDEPLIAFDLELAVRDQDGCVPSIAHTVSDASNLIATVAIDGAVLDMQLKDGIAVAVAEALVERGIPFVIHSGQAEITAPRAWAHVPVIEKPALPEQVVKILAAWINPK